MNKIINYILNKIWGASNRYKSLLETGDSRFFPNFSISTNKSSGKQLHKITVGSQCLIGLAVYLESEEARVAIGDRVYIGNSSIMVKTSVTFGNDILVAGGVIFFDHDSHSLDIKSRDEDIKQAFTDYLHEKGNYLKNKNWEVVNSKPIVINNHVWIGAEALILKGVTIGEGSIVGARSVVTKDVPPHTIVAGNPAKVVRHLKDL